MFCVYIVSRLTNIISVKKDLEMHNAVVRSLELLNNFLKDARVVLEDCEAGRVKLIGSEPKPVFKRVED